MLTDADIDRFVEDGFVAVRGAFPRHERARPGRALLLLVLYTDVGPDDAPTRIRVGSHRLVPELLAPYGDDGVASLALPLGATDRCPVVLATGRAGDVFVCHPFLVHAASWPHRGSGPRWMAQPAIAPGPGFEVRALGCR